MDCTSNQRSFPLSPGQSLSPPVRRKGEHTPFGVGIQQNLWTRTLSSPPCFRSSNLCVGAHYASSWVRLSHSSLNCKLHKPKSLHRHKRCQEFKPCQCGKQSLWLQINKQQSEAGSSGLYHVGGEGEIAIFQKGMVNWPRIAGEEVELQFWHWGRQGNLEGVLVNVCMWGSSYDNAHIQPQVSLCQWAYAALLPGDSCPFTLISCKGFVLSSNYIPLSSCCISLENFVGELRTVRVGFSMSLTLSYLRVVLFVELVYHFPIMLMFSEFLWYFLFYLPSFLKFLQRKCKQTPDGV